MSTYEALVCLMTTLNNIQIHPRVSTFLNQKQIQSLHIMIEFLLDFIESSNSHGGSKEEEVLNSQITCVAHAAEDVIESHVVDQILAGSTGDLGETSSGHVLDLEAVIKDMKSVQEKVMEFKDTMQFKDQQSSYSMLTTSSEHLKAAKNRVMVGSDDELKGIIRRLTGHQRNRQIVPIVGMGGIGKTTLAKNVYENSFIVEQFAIRGWVTVSQEYSVKKVISELGSCLGAFDFETGLEITESQLRLKLHKHLWRRRYLIVLDVVWSIDVWDKIQRFFPDNSCGSRVVITSRISNISSSPFVKNFLDEDNSWRLFCGEVFLEEGCPPELEEMGKNIVRKCERLPLSIVVIGGLLRNSIKKLEHWESVVRDLNSCVISDNDEHCLNILSLSYNHLPAHLKPCFLYMGGFHEDEMIPLSNLIKLFVAEGFLKPKKGQTLEVVAENYLNDLVDRNLILVESRKWNGKIKCCKMHDLVREVCLKIGSREKFFHEMRTFDVPPGIDRERRITFYGNLSWDQIWPRLCDCDALSSPSLARTFVPGRGPLPYKFKLLRVLTSIGLESLEAIFQQVNVRYLTFKLPIFPLNPEELRFKLPSSVFPLWNVQTLITISVASAPREIWYMRQLRHLKFGSIVLPDPPTSDKVEQQDDVLLPNLQTLSRVDNFNFTDEVCKRIPSIKTLRVWYDIDFRQKNCYLNLGLLHKLQSLSCNFWKASKEVDLLKRLVFPSSLRKLTLQKSQLNWEDLNTFGLSLPHLEVLKLRDSAFVGPEWDCVEGAFPRLKFLQIMGGDLVNWNAENSEFFPVLEELHLQALSRLEKIPSGMVEIDTLRYLGLINCSESAAISSTEILEKRVNEDLKVVVYFSMGYAEESFRGKVKTEKLTGFNLESSTSRCIIS